MDKTDYYAYKARAEFFNATGRTLDGIHGLMFRKDVTVEVPETLTQYLENVDGKGRDIRRFISDCVYDSLITGFGGILLDAPEASDYKTVREAEENGITPFLKFYRAEDVYNWHYDDEGRYKHLDRVILRESIEVKNADDDFSYTEKDKISYLKLENEVYSSSYRIANGEPSEPIEPKSNGKSFNKILFYPVPNIEPEKPLLIDLVNVNLAWYRKSADLENGAHWTGVPTPYVMGYEPEIEYDSQGNAKAQKPIYLGGSQMLTFPQGVTGLGYLEYSGAGLSQLRSLLADDEERMAILGARIISQEKKGAEAVETVKMHRAGENSVIATFANSVSNVFENILVDYLSWCSNTEVNPEDVKVHINTDYDISKMSTQELTALVALWQNGGISKRAMFNNLKEGEIVENEITFEDMEKEILDEKEQTLIDNLAVQQELGNGETVNE